MLLQTVPSAGVFDSLIQYGVLGIATLGLGWACWKLIQRQLDQASNMTDRLAALSMMNSHQIPGIAEALKHFYTDFEHEALVIDKWFSLQASAPSANTKIIRKLMQHSAFSMTNPDRKSTRLNSSHVALSRMPSSA